MEKTVERFLILCLRGRWDPEALDRARALAQKSDVDWNCFFRDVYDGQLAPLLYLIVRDQGIVPSSLEESLSYAYYFTGARNAMVLHKLKAVLAALAKETIPVLLLKGAALVERVYHNAAVRPMGDIDLLVPRQHLQTALQTLSRSHRVPERAGTFAGANIAHEQQAVPGSHGYGRMAFDLNCYLVESPYFSHMCFVDWLWKTATPGKIADTPVLEASCEGLVLHLCAHLLMDQKGKQLLWLHDIAESLTLYREQMDWGLLLENAQRYDLALAVSQVLLRVEQDWRVAIPDQWKRRLGALRASPPESRFFAWFASKDQPAPRLFSLSGKGAGSILTLRYMWDNLIPHPAYMMERYRIGNRFLLPLAYPYRWYRGMRSACLDSFPRRWRKTLAAAW